MNFKDYDELSGLTAIYPGKSTGSKDALAYTALGLCGEAGEYSEKVKKYLRDGFFDPHAAMKELGDVLWYLSAAARELGTSLETVAQMNITKLQKRRETNTLSGSGDNREQTGAS
jgi:NTP pyrophosphatase (non-canonical NTP hydrolase)